MEKVKFEVKKSKRKSSRFEKFFLRLLHVICYFKTKKFYGMKWSNASKIKTELSHFSSDCCIEVLIHRLNKKK